MNEKLDLLVCDEIFLQRLLTCHNMPHQARALLAAEDVYMEESDVKALLGALHIRYGGEAELDEDDLTNVAGGVHGFAWLETLPLL